MKISIEIYGDEFSADLKSKVDLLNDGSQLDNTKSDEALDTFIKLMELAGFNMDNYKAYLDEIE